MRFTFINVALEFADSSTYVVLSDDPENLIDNTNYVCAGLGAESEYSTYMFNRLVDWSQVAEVIVNDTHIPMNG